MPPASTGSLGEPVAWAVADESGVWFARLRREDADEAFCRAVAFGENSGRLVPLYDLFTLTQAERETIEWAVRAMRPECRAVLQGLLERTK